MSGLKKFLNRRAEGIAKEKAIKDGVNPDEIKSIKTETKYKVDKDLGIIEYEREVDEIEVSLNLTDDEFWAISNQFMLDSKNSDRPAAEILQTILENYTPLKIKQFAARYEELNK